MLIPMLIRKTLRDIYDKRQEGYGHTCLAMGVSGEELHVDEVVVDRDKR